MKPSSGCGRVYFNLFISIISFVLLYSIIEYPQSAKDQWSPVQLPIRTKITQLHNFKSNQFIAVASKYLINYLNEKWEIFKEQPPVKNIDRLFITPTGNMWLTENTFMYESNLYTFIDSKWEKIETPFLNQIKCADFIDNDKAYFGGDRELYFFNKNHWDFIVYPPTPDAIYEIKTNGKSILTLTSYGQLFLNTKNKWYKQINDKTVIQIEKSNGNYFAVTNKEILKYSGFDKWKEIINTQNVFEIKKCLILNDNLIYVISAKNQLYFFKNKKWNKIEIENSKELNDIGTANNGSIILAGTNGYTWTNKKIESSKKELFQSGFIKSQPLILSKDVNDEYGVCINYLNDDLWLDIYTVRIFEPNRLYINQGNGKNGYPVFNDHAVEREATGINDKNKPVLVKDLFLGCGVADVDNDNDKDIFLCNLMGKNKLFLNNGDGFFRNVSDENQRAQGGNDRTNSVIFGDVDNDGDLDIFVTNEYSSNRLFINNGLGYFTEVTNAAGLNSKWGGMGAAFADIDNDNDLDLCVTNWGTPNKIYKNVSSKGNIKFVDISSNCGIDQSSFNKSNACVFADIDNDGDEDLFITNRKSSNELYINQDGKFKNITKLAIGIDSDLSYGAVFGDFDQDGFQDLYVANIGVHKLYKNINGKYFEDVSLTAGIIQSGYGTGTSVGDLDNDGDLDIYSASYINSSSTIFYNEINNKRFIKCTIKGTISNRDAVGAKIWLYKRGNNGGQHLIGYREVSSGSGYASSNPQVVHFGLASDEKYDLVVYFPASGIKKIIKNIHAGSSLNIDEEASFNSFLTLFKKKLNIIFYDKEILTEEGKFIFLLLIILFSFVFTREKLKWKLRINLIIHLTVFIVYFILLSQFIFKNFLFSTIIPLTSSFIYLAVVHLIYQKYFLLKKINEEKKMVREKIARDLHDDLASTISSAAIYTDYLRRKDNSKNNKTLIDKIHNLMINASNTVNDIIWIAVTKNDTVGDLYNKIYDLILEVSECNLIKLSAIKEIENSELKIEEDYKRNIFLIVKEAINNSLKYSECSKIKLIFRQKRNIIYLKLEDDGKGFDPDKIEIGNNGNGGRGISNMKTRASIIKAVFKISSSPGEGTKILLESKMT